MSDTTFGAVEQQLAEMRRITQAAQDEIQNGVQFGAAWQRWASATGTPAQMLALLDAYDAVREHIAAMRTERPSTATLAGRNDGSDLVAEPVGYVTGYRNADGDWHIPFDGTPFATRDEAATDAQDANAELPGVDWRALTVYDETGEPYGAGER